MAKVTTIKVKMKGVDGVVIINEADFRADKHTLVEGAPKMSAVAAAPPAAPVPAPAPPAPAPPAPPADAKPPEVPVPPAAPPEAPREKRK